MLIHAFAVLVCVLLGGTVRNNGGGGGCCVGLNTGFPQSILTSNI